MQTNPFRLGLAFGVVLALCHATWALMVALVWAQAILDFAFWAHFINPPYRVTAFDFSRTLVLVVLIFVIGLIPGTVGGAVWNRLASSRT